MSKCVVVVCGAFAMALAGVVLSPAPAAEDSLWTEDAKAAMAQAANEKKDLLIDFTGSDWCGWCIRLDKEVFSQSAFTTEVPKHFVLLKLDFPRKKEQTAELKKQNAEWRDKFRVRGYPTIMLTDAEGKPYAKTGYRRGGAEAYVEHLAELRAVRAKRDEAMAKAASAEGLEKARLLDQALSVMDTELAMAAYGDVIDEILKLDASNEAGLKAKYGALASLGKVNAAAQAGNFDEALKLADEALKTLGDTGQPVQDILYIKSMVLYRKQDKPGAKLALEAALKAAPDSDKAPRIKMILERAFKDNSK